MPLILVVEDEEELRAGLVTALARAGFKTAEAANGDDGYRLARDLRPDLVLCDISMAGMRGDVLLTRIRNDFPNLVRMPFIFLTALADRTDIIAGHKLGADDYLTKPIDLEILIAKIDAQLRQAERWHEQYSSELVKERAALLTQLSEQTRLSFLSASELLHHLSEGVILLDSHFRPVFINRAARLILTEEDGISLQDGFLSAPEARQAHRLEIWLNKVRNSTLASSDEPLAIPRRSGRPPYTLRSSDIELGLDLGSGSAATLAIFLSDPDQRAVPDTSLLIKKFVLTPTEANIVLKMAKGYSVNEIALEQGISRNTVHHHLKSIFRKTNSSRQSELVATVLSLSWEALSANRTAI